jgi:primosomal protein N'
MSSAWFGTVEDFLDKSISGALQSEVLSGYQKQFGQSPKEEEQLSWNHSITILANIFADKKFAALIVYIEFAMPSGQQRADFIILGGNDEAPKGLILEFKQWRNFYNWIGELKKHPRRLLLSKSDDAKSVLHPLLQVKHYANQITNGSRIGSRFTWSFLAVLPEMPAHWIAKLLQTQSVRSYANKILGEKNYKAELTKQLESLLPAKISTELAKDFNDSAYYPAHDLIDRIVQNGDAIATKLEGVMESAELTKEQQKLCQDIINSVNRGEKKLFIIEGGPGSGKTYVALLLLIRSLFHKKNSKMAVFGNRLYAILEDCLESAAEGNATVLAKFINLVNQKYSENLDLLICDEAQRMQSKDVKNIFRHANVIVVFFDEQQRLSMRDEGTKEFGAVVDYVFKLAHLSNVFICCFGEP